MSFNYRSVPHSSKTLWSRRTSDLDLSLYLNTLSQWSFRMSFPTNFWANVVFIGLNLIGKLENALFELPDDHLVSVINIHDNQHQTAATAVFVSAATASAVSFCLL